ncbi:MAG: hypothetical protein GX825_01700 [Syntrophomonadaceae bacterium]|nr:hypothetical protein [Syntrophomonadaceae bacterium]
MSKDKRDSIQQLLKERLDLFREIQAISARQLEICQHNEADDPLIEKLLVLIAERQTLMEGIDLINEGISHLQKTDSTMNTGDGWSNEQQIAVVINRNDEVCMAWLRNKSREVAGMLQKTRANREASDAYQMGGPADLAWFVDKRK